MSDDSRSGTGDSGITIEVTPDGFKAYISAHGAGTVTPSAVREALLNKRVSFGVREEVIDSLGSGPLPESRLLIAEGRRPENGKDGFIEYLSGTDTPSRVRKDDRIGEVRQPQEGTGGVNVYGEQVPAPKPQKAALPGLENVNTIEQGTVLVAAIDGYLFIDDFTVRVHPFFTLEISGDKHEASVTVVRLLREGDFGPGDLQSFLKDNGVVYGILDDEIARLFGEGLFERPVVVARGKRVVNGRDGAIRYFFETETKPEEDEHGNVDFKELHLIKNVSAGGKLAEIVPPEPGEEGYTVLGAVIRPVEGKAAVLPMGKNTRPDPSNPAVLQSEIEGSVKLNGNKIEVEHVFVVRKHVDYSTGNLTFVGDVVVNGDVKSGFRIKAKGDVQIDGVLEDAVVECDGSVLVKKGFIGKGYGVIIARGEVILTFCENERVVADGDVTISSYAMNSTIETRGSIIATTNRGVIVGGDYYAVKNIEAKTVGSEHGTPTRLSAGTDMVTRAHLAFSESRIEKIDRLLLKHMRRRLVKKELPDNVKALVRQLHELKENAEKEQAGLLKALDAMDEKEEDFRRGIVKVIDRVHPGTTITIYDQHTTVQDVRSRVQYLYTDEGVMGFELGE